MKTKKIFLIALVLISTMSCTSDKIYTIKYVVFYPNYNDTVTDTNDNTYYWNSSKGTNYIKIGGMTGSTVYSGSAPYKVLSCTSVNKETVHPRINYYHVWMLIIWSVIAGCVLGNFIRSLLY